MLTIYLYWAMIIFSAGAGYAFCDALKAETKFSFNVWFGLFLIYCTFIWFGSIEMISLLNNK